MNPDTGNFGDVDLHEGGRDDEHAVTNNASGTTDHINHTPASRAQPTSPPVFPSAGDAGRVAQCIGDVLRRFDPKARSLSLLLPSTWQAQVSGGPNSDKPRASTSGGNHHALHLQSDESSGIIMMDLEDSDAVMPSRDSWRPCSSLSENTGRTSLGEERAQRSSLTPKLTMSSQHDETMVYSDFSSNDDEWIPNVKRGVPARHSGRIERPKKHASIPQARVPIPMNPRKSLPGVSTLMPNQPRPMPDQPSSSGTFSGKCTKCLLLPPDCLLKCKHLYCRPCCQSMYDNKEPCPRCGARFRSWQKVYLS